MQRQINSLSIFASILLTTCFSFSVLASQDEQIVGYDSASNTVVVHVRDDSDRATSELRWYRDGKLVYRKDSVAGTLFTSAGNTFCLALDVTQDPSGQPKFDFAILNSELQIVKTETISGEIEGLVTLNAHPVNESRVTELFDITCLSDGSFVVEFFETFFKSIGGRFQYIVLAPDLSEFRLVKQIGNGEFVSISEEHIANFDVAARERFIAIVGTDRDGELVDRPRFNGRYSAFICDFQRNRDDEAKLLYNQIPEWGNSDEGWNSDDRIFRELNTFHVTVAPPEGSGRSVLISNLYFDPEGVRMWYSIATMMKHAPRFATLELQCALQVPKGEAQTPILRVYDRNSRAVINNNFGIAEYCDGQRCEYESIIDSVVLNNNKFGVLLSVLGPFGEDRLGNGNSCYRYLSLHIDHDGGVVTTPVFDSQSERKLLMREDGLIVKLDEADYWSFYHFSNGIWNEVSISKSNP
jgi:hypothetical protein